MLTALKKLVSHNDATSSNAPPGVQTMAHSLQKKFARGVQYNMKIIIKGDRNVGKTCLFHRLQGLKFKEEYLPTQEIQVTSIQWNYKATDDVVKVEVWDVVDKAKKKKKLEGLKLDNGAQEIMEEAALDAEFVDVYKNSNGVIMMFDMTKQWTFDYVQRELPKVATHIPVLVLANHRDMGHHRVTTEDDVRFFIDSLERPADAAGLRYTEGSMRNGFGLKILHKFFNLPFLQLQRETLLRQLETNRLETELTVQELDLLQESEDQNYDVFLEALTNKRRQVAEQLSPASSLAMQLPGDTDTPPSCRMLPSSQSTSQVDAPFRASAPRTLVTTSGSTKSKSLPSTPSTPQQPPIVGRLTPVPQSPAVQPSLPQLAAQGQAVSSPAEPKQTATFMARLFGKGQQNGTEKEDGKKEGVSSIIPAISYGDEPVRSVEDFVPDDRLDKSFLEDDRPDKVETNDHVELESDSDDDDDDRNPMVAAFQDDLDPEDSVHSVTTNVTRSPPSPTSHSVPSSDEEKEKTPVETVSVFASAASEDPSRLTTTWLDSAELTENVNSSTQESPACGTDDVEVTPDTQPRATHYVHSLEFEDLSILEKGFPSSGGSTQSPRKLSSSSSGDGGGTDVVMIVNETVASTSSKVKRKEKSKEKKSSESKTHKKKHKKKEHGDKEEKKKSSSSKKKVMRIKNEDNELEDFLNGNTGTENVNHFVVQDYESF